MGNTDFVIRKLRYYLDNFNNLTDEEIKQSNYFVLYKANEQINKLTEMVSEIYDLNNKAIEQNNHLNELLLHYQNFIKDSKLTKRYELYSKKKEVI